MSNPECRTFVTMTQEVMEQLRMIHHLVLYYEADILRNIEFLYINNDNEIECNWTEIKNRAETEDECVIIEAPVIKRVKIG